MADPPSHFTPEALERWRFGSAQANLNNVLCHCRDHGAALWVLRTNQIGGNNPDIEPVAPMSLYRSLTDDRSR